MQSYSQGDYQLLYDTLFADKTVEMQFPSLTDAVKFRNAFHVAKRNIDAGHIAMDMLSEATRSIFSFTMKFDNDEQQFFYNMNNDHPMNSYTYILKFSPRTRGNIFSFVVYDTLDEAYTTTKLTEVESNE